VWPWILAGIAIVLGLILLPVALARRPMSKNRGGGFAPAFAELNAIFSPGERHIQAAGRQGSPERAKDEPWDGPPRG